VEFAVADGQQFNEQELVEAFAKVNFRKTKLVSKPG
jgi:hypothetical protein